MPKPEHIDNHGLCRASLDATEIEVIRAELAGDMSWLGRILRWLEAVKDPTRFKMVYLLHRYESLCVCDLANLLEVTDSAVSQHLRRLRDMELVRSYRVKQTVFYSLDDESFKTFFCRLLGSAEKTPATVAMSA